jgi:hypothetical protein
MVANAVVLYQLQWLRSGKVVTTHGYPIWVTGTVVISIAMCLCVWVVESSTWKAALEPRKTLLGGTTVKLVLLQKGISEQDVPAFALHLVPNRREVQSLDPSFSAHSRKSALIGPHMLGIGRGQT